MTAKKGNDRTDVCALETKSLVLSEELATEEQMEQSETEIWTRL